MTDFYMIYVVPKLGIAQEHVEQQMDRALDWFRFNRNLWIVYTTSDSAKWFARLSPLVKPTGSLFICRLDVTKRHGWFNKELWTWIRSKKS